MQFNLKSVLFAAIPKKISITIDEIRNFIDDKEAKRIDFSTTHIHSLRRTESEEGGSIKLPFSDTINPIIQKLLGEDKRLFTSRYGGVWHNISTNKEYQIFEKFVSEYKGIVFLRDNMDLSLALSMNYDGDERSEIGELEYRAKFCNNKSAENELINLCKKWIEKLPFYKDADYICAMPSSNIKKGSLPLRIVNALDTFDFLNISTQVLWNSKTRDGKDAESTQEKLEILEESGFTLTEGLDLNGKAILLVDDLYMSGVSMQYVAMKLKEAGAERIFGLCIVKSRSNTTR